MKQRDHISGWQHGPVMYPNSIGVRCAGSRNNGNIQADEGSPLQAPFRSVSQIRHV